MLHLKAEQWVNIQELAKQHDKLTFFLTYADNNAVTFFAKQGFTTEVTRPREQACPPKTPLAPERGLQYDESAIIPPLDWHCFALWIDYTCGSNLLFLKTELPVQHSRPFEFYFKCRAREDI